MDQNVLVTPEIKDLSGGLVHVLTLARQLQTDHIVGILVNERQPFLLTDDIIRRTAQGADAACLAGVISHSAKRFDFSHNTLSPFLSVIF